MNSRRKPLIGIAVVVLITPIACLRQPRVPLPSMNQWHPTLAYRQLRMTTAGPYIREYYTMRGNYDLVRASLAGDLQRAGLTEKVSLFNQSVFRAPNLNPRKTKDSVTIWRGTGLWVGPKVSPNESGRGRTIVVYERPAAWSDHILLKVNKLTARIMGKGDDRFVVVTPGKKPHGGANIAGRDSSNLELDKMNYGVFLGS